MIIFLLSFIHQIASISTPRYNSTVAAYENEIFSIGGVDNEGKSSVVERYNASENKWITIEPLNCPISHLTVTTIRSN